MIALQNVFDKLIRKLKIRSKNLILFNCFYIIKLST